MRRLPAGSAVAGDDGPSATVLPALLRQVDADRTKRQRRVAARATGLAAVAAAVLVTGVQIATTEPTDVAAVVVLDSPRRGTDLGEAELVTKPWGTAVTLQVSQLPDTGPFTLQVADADGRRESAAIWGATPNGHAEVVGATSLSPADIRSVQVIGPGGAVLAAG